MNQWSQCVTAHQLLTICLELLLFFSPILKYLQEFNFLQFLILYLGPNDAVCLLSMSIKQNNGLLKFPMVFYDFEPAF